MELSGDDIFTQFLKDEGVEFVTYWSKDADFFARSYRLSEKNQKVGIYKRNIEEPIEDIKSEKLCPHCGRKDKNFYDSCIYCGKPFSTDILESINDLSLGKEMEVGKKKKSMYFCPHHKKVFDLEWNGHLINRVLDI